jgi:hypothetical protein
MRRRNILNAAMALGFASLAVVIVFAHSDALLAGTLYLAVASFLGVLSVCFAAVAPVATRTSFQGTRFSLEIRSGMLILVAWQIAIVGTLNILAADSTGLTSLFIVPYVLAALFFAGSYRLVSIADSPTQDGGYIPLNFFGQPRTRRLGFVVYTVGFLLALTIASIECALDGEPRPSILRHPQLSLLMAAITSAISSIFLYERYRGKVTKRYAGGAKGRIQGVTVLASTLCILACAAVIQTVFSYSRYTFVLSAIILLGSGLTVNSLWKIGESTQSDPHEFETT